MATLIVMIGPCEGKAYPLESSSLVSVGRDDQCSFQLVDNEIKKNKEIKICKKVNKIHFSPKWIILPMPL